MHQIASHQHMFISKNFDRTLVVEWHNTKAERKRSEHFKKALFKFAQIVTTELGGTRHCWQEPKML